MKGRPENSISGYISGTGNLCHDTFTLHLWPYFSFQTSSRLFKSVQPSLRKRCEFDGSRPKYHISGYNSGTVSRRHNPFALVQCPYNTFRMSPRLFESVQPSPRKRYEFNGSRPKNHISGYISRTKSRCHIPFTLVQCPYIYF